jgi:hypothetical protein
MMSAAEALAEAKAKGLVKEDIDECEYVCFMTAVAQKMDINQKTH